MKRFTISLIALVLTMSIFSCKKDNVEPPTQSQPGTSMDGRWVGLYDYLTTSETYYYSFVISADGKMQEVWPNGKVVGEGTWELKGNKFTATYLAEGAAQNHYTVTATYDSKIQKLSGTWGKTGQPIKGNFAMVKQ